MIGILLIFLLLGLPSLKSMTVSDILQYIPDVPLIAALILILFYCLKAVTMVLPVTVLNVCAGILFPPLPAIAVALAGNACETGIGYWMGRGLDRKKLSELLAGHQGAAHFLALYKKHGAATCFITRILPIPIEPCSMYFSASGMPFGTYMLYSMLGLSSRMIPWTIAGSAITNPLSIEFLVPFLISIVITVSMFLLMQYLQKWEQGHSPKTIPSFLRQK